MDTWNGRNNIRLIEVKKMSIDEAEIWLRQVVKGGLADKETIKAIEVMLRSYNAILTNYNALEEDMDKLQEEMTVSELKTIIEEHTKCVEYCTCCKFHDCCQPMEDAPVCDVIEDIINIAKEIKEVE